MRSLAITGVSKAFGPLPVLDEVSLALEPGQFGAIVGPSGCGKSTLLRMVAGLERPDRGQVLVDGRPVGGPGPDRILIFQEHALYPWRTVAENAGFGLELAGVPRAARMERVARVLAQVGLAGFEGYYPGQLSGGMRQRAAIARALVLEPQMLLLDEPYGALDAMTRLAMQQELMGLWATSGQTMLLITHDVDEALYLADRVFVMSPRPGRVLRVLEPGPRPRQRGSAEFAALRQAVLEQLGLAG